MMSRHPRVHAEGLLYHVMARGNDGQKYESVKLCVGPRAECQAEGRVSDI